MGIIEIIEPKRENLGPLTIRRSLPSAARQMIGPFIFMDQGGPAELPAAIATGVGEHPHAGLSTFTYLLAGTMMHRDSAGYSGRIEAGDIALMTAGSGITHEERPDPDDPSPTQTAYFVQMWLALPDAVEDMDPAFELHRAADLPTVDVEGGQVRLLIGSGLGVSAPTTTYCETLFADLQVAPGGTVSSLPMAEERGLYVLEGDAMVDGQALEPCTLAVLSPDAAVNVSSQAGCRAVVLGGAPFASPRVIAGSYVASSMEKLRAWDQAYRSGDFPSIA